MVIIYIYKIYFFFFLKRSDRPRILLGLEHGNRCPDKSVKANAGVLSGHIKTHGLQWKCLLAGMRVMA